MTKNAIAIAAYAVALLTRWDWSKGEPLAALTLASTELFGEELHTEIASVQVAEREYAPGGTLSNNVETRRRALRAVVLHRS